MFAENWVRDMKTIHLLNKALKAVKEEGIQGCAQKTKGYIENQKRLRRKLDRKYADVLFISGCGEDLPHPWRYRVKHQREQLEAYNYTTDEVYFTLLELDQIRYYRGFVFFRCPMTETIEQFVDLAKQLNKPVIYDIDDLVIDTRYTDQIKYVMSMDESDKKAYDENVMNMQKLLMKCDFAITSTNCLADELKKYVPKVYINRNVASEKMIQLSKEAIKARKKDDTKVKIGYFSGSITHNADFEMIKSVIIEILEKYENVELYLAGELDLPVELMPWKERIKKYPFGDWRKLPEILVKMDINLAPLEDTIFNKAKSENKWMEAALVKVVTVASDVGAFHDCIEDGKTGILCKNNVEWKNALERLIVDATYRRKLSEQAYQYCINHYTTIESGYHLTRIIENELNDNYVFVLPGLEISGGIKVALKHATMLQKSGKDVELFLLNGNQNWCEFDGCRLPAIDLEETEIKGKISYMIATMWSTVDAVEYCVGAKEKMYLVQNWETGFYLEGDSLRMRANQSYMSGEDMHFLTISKWCQKWLKEKYGHESDYAPNGLETERFHCKKRKMDGKIRILIEGDCAVDYKNVDEAFEVTNGLDRKKYEVWYMSYNAEPKAEYKVDKFLHKVPYEKVPEIYEQCDVLLKTSLLESFSYPPLEMMATGGYVIVVPNGGNIEYLKDRENCLLYEAGDIKQARKLLQELQENPKLQEQLYEGGRKTAENRRWENIEYEILKMYHVE